MNSRNLVTLILMTSLMSLSLVTSVQAGKDKPKPASGKEIRVKEGLDEANAEAQEEIRDNTRARRNENRDVAVDEDVDVEVLSDQHGEMTDAASERMDSQENRKRADAELKGNERAQEMRARRDERKAIKEEYKSDRNAGRELASGLDPEVKSEEVAEEAEAAEDTKKKAKKPWWKLWED